MKYILLIFTLLPILGYSQATLIDKSQISASGASTNQILKWNGTAWVFANDENSGTVTGTGTSGYVAFWTGSNSLAGNSGLFWNNSNNRLGIGTTDPSVPVDIVRTSAGSTVVGLKITNLTANATGVKSRIEMPVFNGVSGGVIEEIGNSIDGYRLNIYQDQATGTVSFGSGGNNTRMTIGSTGNVGIGVTTPSTNLEILGSNPTLRLSDSRDFASSGQILGGLEFYSNDPSGNYPAVGASVQAINLSSFGSGTGLIFSVNGDAASPIEAMRIDNSRNVGIGQSSPTARLHVVGSDNSTSTNNILFESLNGTDLLKITNAGIITMPTTANAGTDTDRFMVLTSSSEVAQRTGDQVLQDIGVPTYVASRGENLITNGSGLMGNNYNFSPFTFDASDAYYASGSFKTPTTQGSFFVSEFIPVDATKTYRGTVFAKLNPYVAGNLSYFGMVAYDIDGYSIGPFNHMYQANTLTTLAQPLNVGDTIMYLTSAANWNNTAAGNQLRSIIFWDYVNLGGYVYPELTYSRNWLDNAYNIGQINYTTNTIRLRVPYAGPVKPAGTKLSNGNSGGTYKYFIASAVNVPNTWTQYTGVLDGVDLSGTNVTNKFPPGTARIKLMYLYNYGTAGGVLWTSNISFGLDNPTGAGTTNYVSKWTSSGNLGSSQIFDNGSSVSIGTTSPASTSILDITSTTKGILIPRMTLTQRDAITSPATGLQIYNTTSNVFQYYNGTSWTNVGGSSLSGTSSFIPYFNTSSTLGTTGLKWDNTNSYLGINNFSPGATLAVAGGSDAANTFSLYVTNNAGDKYINFENSGKVGINVAYPKTTLSVNGSVSRKAAVRTGVATSYTVVDTDSWIICTNTSSTVTLTLPSASDFQGREIMVRNAAAIAVNSASSNVISLTSNPGNNPPTTTTSILPATAGKWATLVSSQAADSSWYWIIMQAN